MEEYSISIVINISFWVIGIITCGRYSYKAGLWFGYKYVGPAIGKILNLKNKDN